MSETCIKRDTLGETLYCRGVRLIQVSIENVIWGLGRAGVFQ